MQSQFAAQTMPLGQLFASHHTIQTPPYQRTFAWEQREASQLIEDLVAATLDAGEDGEADGYFLGTMLFMEVERVTNRLAALPFSRAPRQAHLLEVVDGLQRLTTLTILFCVIRDLDAADGVKPNERLLTAIGNGPGTTRCRLSLREPDEAFFQRHVRAPGATRVGPPDADLSPAERRMVDVRDHLFQTMQDFDVSQRGRLAAFLLDKCQVVMVSTTGIDRAHRIFTVLNARGKPLARNDILKAEMLASVPPAALPRITAIWDQAALRLGEDFESLFSHIRTLHGRSSPQIISAIRSIATEAGGGLAFIERIVQPASAILHDINHARHAGSPHSGAISASLTYLGWLKGNSDWVPPVIQWWLGRGREPAELAWFLGALDRLAYGLRILGLGTKRRASRFSAIAQAIRSGRDLQAPGSPLNLTREELRTVHHNFRDLHARSAPMAKLVLLRLNDHLAGGPQAVPSEDLSIEHLLPRKPGANSPWRAVFPDPAERDRYTESLGNLVLVTKAQNDKAGNLDFLRKKDVLFKAGGPSLPINAFVREQAEWTSSQIKEREAELLRHLDQLWKIGPAPVRTEGAKLANAQQRNRPPRAASGG
jgi:hypothetical protein